MYFPLVFFFFIILFIYLFIRRVCCISVETAVNYVPFENGLSGFDGFSVFRLWILFKGGNNR